MEITKNDFETWWNAPVAIEFKRNITIAMAKIARSTMVEHYYKDNLAYAEKVGLFNGLLSVLEMDYDMFIDIGEEEE